MKKILCMLLSFALMAGMAACGGNEPAPTTLPATVPPTQATEEPTTVPPTEPEPTEPESKPGTIRAEYGELVYCTFEKGTEVTVIGEFLDYYVIRGEQADLLLDKRFTRLATDEPFEERPGYAKWNAPLYDNPYLQGEPVQKLKSNFKVTVKDGKDGWLYVEWDDGSGYVSEDQIRNRPGSGGGGGGGGGGDGSDVPMGSLSYGGGNPGMSLLGAYSGPEFVTMEDTAAKVLIPDAQGYLALLNRGDTVKVVEAADGNCSIYYDGFMVTAPRWLIRMEEDSAYESWTGYARNGSAFYSEYQLRNQIQQLRTNTKITVLDELPYCYVVEIDGQIGYMNLESVSKSRFSSGGGGGGGGGEWTPPAM